MTPAVGLVFICAPHLRSLLSLLRVWSHPPPASPPLCSPDSAAHLVPPSLFCHVNSMQPESSLRAVNPLDSMRSFMPFSQHGIRLLSCRSNIQLFRHSSLSLSSFTMITTVHAARVTTQTLKELTAFISFDLQCRSFVKDLIPFFLCFKNHRYNIPSTRSISVLMGVYRKRNIRGFWSVLLRQLVSNPWINSHPAPSPAPQVPNQPVPSIVHSRSLVNKKLFWSLVNWIFKRLSAMWAISVSNYYFFISSFWLL